MTGLIRCAGIVLLACACSFAAVPFANIQEIAQGKADTSTPTDILSSAKTIFIRTKSVYFKPATLENALLKRAEFQQWGLAISREKEDADLIIEVDRKLFTTSFVYSVIDPRNKRVVASGRVNSIGGTVEGKISDSFIKRMRQIRSLTPSSNAK